MIENNNYGALNNEQETTNKIPSSNSAGSRQRFDIVEPNYNSTGCVIQKWTFKYTGVSGAVYWSAWKGSGLTLWFDEFFSTVIQWNFNL